MSHRREKRPGQAARFAFIDSGCPFDASWPGIPPSPDQRRSNVAIVTRSPTNWQESWSTGFRAYCNPLGRQAHNSDLAIESVAAEDIGKCPTRTCRSLQRAGGGLRVAPSADQSGRRRGNACLIRRIAGQNHGHSQAADIVS